jgi:hypothetical protein
MNLNKLKEKALSGEEVLKLVNNRANLIKYPELSQSNNLLDILKPFGACIILYETKLNYGHWCCLIKRGDIIEHFDSYGLMPDDELKYVDNVFRKQNNMKIPHLTYLLINLPKKYKIEYNQHKLQEKKKGINTCGRWTGLRINNKNMPIDDFADCFKDKYFNPDDIAVLETINI